MDTPTSFQQGQGLAQIFQGNMAADVYAYQQQLRAQQEAERRKRADLANKELSGKFDALNKKKIFEARDTDEFRNKVEDIRNKYAGKWEELYRGDTPLRRDLEKDLTDVSLWADQSAATKAQLKDVYKDMFIDNADKYTDEQRKSYEDFITKPGDFNIPYKQWVPFENVDIEDTFRKLAYEPAAKEAVDRFTTDKGWKGLESYGSISQTKLPNESVDAHWNNFISDPAVQNALYHKYGADAEAAGMELNEYVKQNTPYYDRLKIDKKKTDYGLINKEGDNKSFDPSFITTFDRAQTRSKFKIDPNTGKPTDDNPLFNKLISSSVKDAPFYPINYPVTVQTTGGAIDWNTGTPLKGNMILTGSVAGYTVIPTKNNRINNKGSKQAHAIIRTTDGFDIAVPIEQVANQGKQKGYDVENIINGLYQYDKPVKMAAPQKKEIKASDVANKAAAAGYSVEEYTTLLNKNGVQIIE